MEVEKLKNIEVIEKLYDEIKKIVEKTTLNATINDSDIIIRNDKDIPKIFLKIDLSDFDYDKKYYNIRIYIHLRINDRYLFDINCNETDAYEVSATSYEDAVSCVKERINEIVKLYDDIKKQEKEYNEFVRKIHEIAREHEIEVQQESRKSIDLHYNNERKATIIIRNKREICVMTFRVTEVVETTYCNSYDEALKVIEEICKLIPLTVFKEVR